MASQNERLSNISNRFEVIAKITVKKHLLIDIVVVTVCCVICGANFVEIQTIANGQPHVPFTQWHSIRTTHSIVFFARIRQKNSDRAFFLGFEDGLPWSETQHVALDGRTPSQDG